MTRFAQDIGLGPAELIGLPAGPLEHERGVGSAGDAVGAQHLGREVVAGGLAHMVHEQYGHAEAVGNLLDPAHGGIVGVVWTGS
jgi:hypothetical protein